MKISYAEGSADAKDNKGAPLSLFILNVLPDPVLGSSTGICTFLFREGMTGASELPYVAMENDNSDSTSGNSATLGTGPLTIRSYLPIERYLKTIYCLDIMQKWHVSSYQTASGFWIEYRNGIDAIWTGRGLPVREQTFEERLDLTPGLIEKAMELTAEKLKNLDETNKGRNATVDTGADDDRHRETNGPIEQSAVTKSAADETAVHVESDKDVTVDQEEDVTDAIIARIEAEEEKNVVERRVSKAEIEREKLIKQYEIDARYHYSKKCNVSLEELNRTVNGTISKVEIEKCQLNAQESEEEKAEREKEKEAWVEKMKLYRERNENRTREAELAFKAKEQAIALERSTLAAKKRKLLKMERNAQKILRKAYYAKSIRWHPDRWVGLNTYADIVRETFEAITEAYDGLQSMITRLSKQNMDEFTKREETMKMQKRGEGIGADTEKTMAGHKQETIVPEAPEEPKTPSTNPELFS